MTVTTARTAYFSSQGRGVGHTMRCATVGRYEKLRNGVGKGQCPNLREATYDEVMRMIESRGVGECRLCRVMRLKAEAERLTEDYDEVRACTYEFGDEISFTNRWGQENQIGTVIRQAGDQLFIEYLGIGNLFDLTTMQIIETDGLGRPVVAD